MTACLSLLVCSTLMQTAPAANPGSRPLPEIAGLPAEIPSLSCPVFEFEGATVGGMEATPVQGDPAGGDPVRFSFTSIPAGDFGPLEVELFLQWSPGERVLRKWARYRISPIGHPALLKTVTLDAIDAAKAGLITKLTRELAPPDGPQSHPIFLKGLFVGVEFPIAATRLAGNTVILAHHPGRWLTPGTWYESRKAVYGMTAPDCERAAFERYIAAHRPSPHGLHVDYNSWWSAPVHYSQDDILKLMAVFNEKLTAPFGVSFDTFCIDMGWSTRRGLWDIDAKTFPEGFTPIEKASEKMNSRLGLWISPSNRYSPASFDNTWAMFNGYETFFAGLHRSVCLAGPRYAAAFRECLVEMAKRYHVRQFKFDGYLCECGELNHGHEPGLLSAEPVAESIITTFNAIHQAAPDAWLETTCFGWNPSPWWLFYANSIIGTFGEDCPYGRVPCPVYRESYTSARDFYNLQGAARLPAPASAQEVLGIIHQGPEDFLNDAVITLMRGHMFLPVYMNPKYMNDARWRAFAEFLKWARGHAAALEQTSPILPASWADGRAPKFTSRAAMPREPYGYIHRYAGGALIALRNPWIAPRCLRLNLADIWSAGTEPSLNQTEPPGLPPLAKGGSGGVSADTDGPAPMNALLSAVSIYPEARLYAQDLRPDGTLEVPLAPYETVVLSIAPTQPTAGLPLAAAQIGHVIDADVIKCETGRVLFDSPPKSMGPDQTSPLACAGPATQLNLQADVLVRAPKAELLVLLEGKQPPVTPAYRLTVNGAEPEVTSSTPADGFSAAGEAHREQWLFLRAPLPTGPNRIQLDLWDDRDAPNASVWIWSYRTNRAGPPDYPGLLPAPELISLDAVKLADLADRSTRNRPPATAPASATQPTLVARPITRIDGVFLDSLDPASVSQSYGKLQRNRSVAEQPLTIGARRFARGLGTHARSRIVYNLDGHYRRFQSWAGADGWTRPTITFEVRVDGQKRWSAGLTTRADPARWVDIDVTGAKELELLAGDGGNGFTSDHADWAEARLLK
jgi:hypothetical protein